MIVWGSWRIQIQYSLTFKDDSDGYLNIFVRRHVKGYLLNRRIPKTQTIKSFKMCKTVTNESDIASMKKKATALRLASTPSTDNRKNVNRFWEKKSYYEWRNSSTSELKSQSSEWLHECSFRSTPRKWQDSSQIKVILRFWRRHWRTHPSSYTLQRPILDHWRSVREWTTAHREDGPGLPSNARLWSLAL